MLGGPLLKVQMWFCVSAPLAACPKAMASVAHLKRIRKDAWEAQYNKTKTC